MMRPTVSSMLFLAAVLLLPTGQGQNSYSRLQPAVKKFVDLAIDNANQQHNYGHLNFYEIGDIKQVSPHQVKIYVRLRATTCRKAKEHRHRPECPFKLLQVRCFVCSPDQHTSEPFIDCVRRRDEKTRHAIWDKHCKAAPLKGKFSLLVGDSPSVTITSSTHLIFKDLICYSGDGRDYRGTFARTISGKTCQRWSARTPHIHNRTPGNYPCKGLDNNYCRNPDNERMPWCYTTDSQTRWEYCQVPRCVGVPQPALEPTMFPEMTCFTCEGLNYRGTVSRTISGKTCQRWSDQTPHSHERTPENYPHRGLDINYCRNPDNEMMPWCYTTDSQQRWEYCQIPRCGDPPQPVAPQPEPPTIVPEMTCYSADGSNYRGTVARTISGKTCQRWSDLTPHRHQRMPTNYPCNDLDNNYCRNPDNERMPWCYTTDSQTRWEYCQIPTCDGVPEPASEPTIVPELTCFSCKGVNYRGEVARTISGKTCQRWSAQTPHSHVRTPEDYPHEGLDSNYCRNPDNERMPWCYTTDSRTRWDFCDVPRCGVPKPATQFSQCGKLGFSLLVFGGRQSSPGDHPWQASVQTRTTGTSEPFKHSCGGVLIDSCWVLTAAHCINSSKDMQVVLGGVDIATHEESDQVIPVERPIIHDDYRTSSYAVHCDIALLQLQVTDSPLCAKETAFVKTACLPNQLFPDGTACVVSGWGRTETQRRPDKLSNAVVPLISQHRCMAPHVYGDLLDDTMICAGYLAGEVDACKGDSGGPLMCQENGVHYVAGTVSWAYGCALKNKPGLYANIYKYREWITRMMSPYSSDYPEYDDYPDYNN